MRSTRFFGFVEQQTGPLLFDAFLQLGHVLPGIVRVGIGGDVGLQALDRDVVLLEGQIGNLAQRGRGLNFLVRITA